jgi:hypothetical protein
LYRNNGDGHFTNVGATAGIDLLAAGRTPLWFDFDDDHLVDLFIGVDCFNSSNPNCQNVSSLRLYRQFPAGVFTDVTLQVGLSNAGTQQFFGHRSGVCCGDIDLDGDLDLLVGQWEGELELYINLGGVFENQSAARGIVNPNAPSPHNPWQSVMCDFNGDGWLDIYTAVDFFPNQFYLNQRDGTFIELGAASGAAFAFNDMGVTLGDVDDDGDFDIYVTNVFEDMKRNLLLRNDSTIDNVAFSEISQAAGVDDTQFGWGCTFFDADNDADLDLAVTNGWFNGIGFRDTSRIFRREDGDGVSFVDVSEKSGFNDEFFGSCLITADLNRDGDLDLLQVCNPAELGGPFRILENQLQETAPRSEVNWLVVQPRQADKNHWSIGAVVTVEIGERRLTRLIHAGTSMHGQEPPEAVFGLGTAEMVDRVIVRWPFGDQTVWENVASNQVLRARDADFNLDGRINLLDIFPFVASIGPCKELCQADLNHDLVVNGQDVVLFINELVK